MRVPSFSYLDADFNEFPLKGGWIPMPAEGLIFLTKGFLNKSLGVKYAYLLLIIMQ